MYRLHQVVERGDLIALGNVVRIAGHEDDLHGVVLLPQLFRQIDAVHGLHFDVQQEDVLRDAGEEVVLSAFVFGDAQGDTAALGPFSGQAAQEQADVRGVVDDGEVVEHGGLLRGVDDVSIAQYP